MYTNICKHCKKVFRSRNKRSCCSGCVQMDDELFDRIMVYLREYPNSNALQIAEGLGIDAYEVVGYMAEGRLYVSPGKLQRLPADREEE